MPDAETALQTARRHVREGEARLARQEALVLEMEAGCLSGTLPIARQLLEAMRASLDHFRTDLERLERQNSQ
jgi:hypothetical protein